MKPHESNCPWSQVTATLILSKKKIVTKKKLKLFFFAFITSVFSLLSSYTSRVSIVNISFSPPDGATWSVPGARRHVCDGWCWNRNRTAGSLLWRGESVDTYSTQRDFFWEMEGGFPRVLWLSVIDSSVINPWFITLKFQWNIKIIWNHQPLDLFSAGWLPRKLEVRNHWKGHGTRVPAGHVGTLHGGGDGLQGHARQGKWNTITSDCVVSATRWDCPT